MVAAGSDSTGMSAAVGEVEVEVISEAKLGPVERGLTRRYPMEAQEVPVQEVNLRVAAVGGGAGMILTRTGIDLGDQVSPTPTVFNPNPQLARRHKWLEGTTAGEVP
jgi:hypothetical protein